MAGRRSSGSEGLCWEGGWEGQFYAHFLVPGPVHFSTIYWLCFTVCTTPSVMTLQDVPELAFWLRFHQAFLSFFLRLVVSE